MSEENVPGQDGHGNHANHVERLVNEALGTGEHCEHCGEELTDLEINVNDLREAANLLGLDVDEDDETVLLGDEDSDDHIIVAATKHGFDVLLWENAHAPLSDDDEGPFPLAENFLSPFDALAFATWKVHDVEHVHEDDEDDEENGQHEA